MSDTYNCDGQIKTSSGSFYQCGAMRWRKIKDRMYSAYFLLLLVGVPSVIALLFALKN